MDGVKDVCKMIYATVFRCKKLTFISILEVLADAAYVYIPLILLTPLIASIQTKNIENALMAGMLYIISKGILYIINSMLENKRIFLGRVENEKDVNKFYDKTCKVPYKTARDNDFIQKSNNAANALYYEFDYNDIIDSGVLIVKSIVNMLCSVSIIMVLICSKPKTEGGILTLIATPVISFLLIGIFLVVMYMLSSMFSRKNMQKLNELMPEHYSIENTLAYYKNNVIYNYSAYISYKIYGMYRLLRERIKKNTQDNVNFFMKTRNLSLKNTMENNAVSGIVTIVSYGFTIIKIITGAVSTASLLTYSLGITNIYTMCANIQKQYKTLAHGLIYYKNIEEIMQEKEETYNNITDGLSDTDRLVIEFRNVSYRYPGKEDYALQNVSFTMEKGKRYALVGENGAGKSTIIHLLCRLDVPVSGEILLNGKNIQDYSLGYYRNLIAPVFQDVSLYPVPLIENITMSEKDIDESRVKDAMLKAGFSDSKKYDLNFVKEYRETERYSGGERQKVSISQAFYRDRQIYLMDEPNAALDPVSESKLYDSLNKETAGHMVMFISHRLGVCKSCDSIIVLSRGRVVENGTHDELINADGEYKTLWDKQLS